MKEKSTENGVSGNRYGGPCKTCEIEPRNFPVPTYIEREASSHANEPNQNLFS